jgi:UDP-glucuronate 4-epimerase
LSKFLLTGCAGFIGSHVAELLLTQGHSIIGIDNFDSFYPRELKEKNISSFINNPNFTLIESDITDKKTYSLLPTDFDFVIHLAAKAGVRPSIEDPESYVKTNILGTQNILNWMVEMKIKKLIFASSSSVYGNNEKLPFSEDDDVNSPVSPYAYTKISCEMLNLLWHQLYNLDIINLRFFTVYGPRQRPDLAIRKFANAIMENETIALYGDGSSARDYTYIEDIINGIDGAIKYLQKNEKVFETINLGNSSPVKLIELTELLQKQIGKPGKIVFKPMQAGDVNNTYADITKAQKLLNFKPKTPIAEGLKTFVNWLDNNR